MIANIKSQEFLQQLLENKSEEEDIYLNQVVAKEKPSFDAFRAHCLAECDRIVTSGELEGLSRNDVFYRDHCMTFTSGKRSDDSSTTRAPDAHLVISYGRSKERGTPLYKETVTTSDGLQVQVSYVPYLGHSCGFDGYQDPEEELRESLEYMHVATVINKSNNITQPYYGFPVSVKSCPVPLVQYMDSQCDFVKKVVLLLKLWAISCKFKRRRSRLKHLHSLVDLVAIHSAQTECEWAQNQEKLNSDQSPSLMRALVRCLLTFSTGSRRVAVAFHDVHLPCRSARYKLDSLRKSTGFVLNPINPYLNYLERDGATDDWIQLSNRAEQCLKHLVEAKMQQDKILAADFCKMLVYGKVHVVQPGEAKKWPIFPYALFLFQLLIIVFLLCLIAIYILFQHEQKVTLC